MDFLRDPIWQFVGVIIAFVALVLTILLFRMQARRKEILWDINSNISISSFSISDKLKRTIVFGEEPLDDVSLIILGIWNSGNVEILPNDFIFPIRFDFGKDAKVLEAEIAETMPISIKSRTSITMDTKTITLEPLLLNSKDSITLKVLLTQFNGEISVDARIAGIKQVSRPVEKETYVTIIGSAFSKTLLVFLGLFLVSGIFTAIMLSVGSFLGKYISTKESALLIARGVLAIMSLIPGTVMLYFIGSKLQRRKYSNWFQMLLLLPPLILSVICFVLLQSLLVLK